MKATALQPLTSLRFFAALAVFCSHLAILAEGTIALSGVVWMFYERKAREQIKKYCGS